MSAVPVVNEDVQKFLDVKKALVGKLYFALDKSTVKKKCYLLYHRVGSGAVLIAKSANIDRFIRAVNKAVGVQIKPQEKKEKPKVETKQEEPKHYWWQND